MSFETRWRENDDTARTNANAIDQAIEEARISIEASIGDVDAKELREIKQEEREIPALLAILKTLIELAPQAPSRE